MTDSDDAIARYLRELDSADLARSDIDEIEDHLRTLTDELRTSGMPAAEAVTEAARRLGDPRAVAREHARVRTAFGARLSRLRTYSAALLLLPIILRSAWLQLTDPGPVSVMGVEILLATIVVIALVLRLAWARPILVGGLAFLTHQIVAATAIFPDTASPWTLCIPGALVFVMPWGRRELSPAGWSLALCVWAYSAACICLLWQTRSDDGSYSMIAPAALFAGIAAVIATIAGILRARGAALAAMATAGTLAVAIVELWHGTFAAWPSPFLIYAFSAVASGILAALLGAVLAWRTARSTLGSFQYVFR